MLYKSSGQELSNLFISTANLRLALRKGNRQSIADGMGYVHENSVAAILNKKVSQTNILQFYPLKIANLL